MVAYIVPLKRESHSVLQLRSWSFCKYFGREEVERKWPKTAKCRHYTSFSGKIKPHHHTHGPLRPLGLRVYIHGCASTHTLSALYDTVIIRRMLRGRSSRRCRTKNKARHCLSLCLRSEQPATPKSTSRQVQKILHLSDCKLSLFTMLATCGCAISCTRGSQRPT